MGRVAVRRAEVGITQEAMARAARISLRYAAMLDKDEASPSIIIAQRVAAALQCHVDDLWPPEHATGGAR